MKEWTPEDLEKIRNTDDLHISPFRSDGETYGTPTWIWSVVVEDQLFVRAYNGQRSRWYQSAISQKAGRIRAAGQEWKVSFEPVDAPDLNEKIDQAYRSKYADSAYLRPMISEGPRSATIRISPREESSDS